MFDTPDDEFSQAIDILYMQKTVFDSTGEDVGCVLDYDMYFMEAIEFVEKVADRVETWCHDYFDDTTNYTFYFDKMQDYYNLVRIIALHDGIKFKKHPYVAKAEKFIGRQIYSMGNYCISHELYVSKKLTYKKKNALYIRLYCEFSDYLGLVKVLYEIRDFFIEETAKLEKLVKSYNRKNTIKMPDRKTQRRAA